MSDVTDHEDKSTRETSMVAIEERLAKLPTRDLRAWFGALLSQNRCVWLV